MPAPPATREEAKGQGSPLAGTLSNLRDEGRARERESTVTGSAERHRDNKLAERPGGGEGKRSDQIMF